MTCPICKSSSRRKFMKDTYWIRSCDVCRHQFAELAPGDGHVRAIYGDDYFTGGGAGYDDYLSEAELLRAHGRCYGRLLDNYMTPGSVLDVGAAGGFVLQGLFDWGWKGSGLEPNATMAAYARDDLGVPVATGSLESFQSEDRFQLISLIQVIPHFANIQRALQAAASVTEPGGFWLVETWNRESWTAWCLGTKWHEYSPPSVLHWFSPEGLRQLAASYGFREVARGRPRKWLNGGHAKSLLQAKCQDIWWMRLALGALGVIPDKLPIPYPAEDLFWMLFQDRRGGAPHDDERPFAFGDTFSHPSPPSTRPEPIADPSLNTSADP